VFICVRGRTWLVTGKRTCEDRLDFHVGHPAEETQRDRPFSALSDPTRRTLLARLEGEDGLSICELAQPFPVLLPAIMKHLDDVEGPRFRLVARGFGKSMGGRVGMVRMLKGADLDPPAIHDIMLRGAG
jgi:DNA-binding transcriptional ArsR family regulator